MPDLGWLDAGTAWFEGRVREADLDGPSALPGWTGRHVAAHVAANANALGRLVRWARTGEETPMYASPEARDAEIEELALLGPGELRELVHATAADLRAAIGALPEACWEARVRTAQGREVPASEVVWMRTREVWVHGADLGGSFEDFPDGLVDALAQDVIRAWDARGQGPWMTLRPLDRTTAWQVAPPTPKVTKPEDVGRERVGPEDAKSEDAGLVAAVGPPTVSGTAAALAAWLTGRGPAPAPDAPSIGRWL